MEKSKIDEILVSLGFGFPESKNDNIAFEETFEKYQFEADANKIDSEKILKSLKPKKDRKSVV